MHHVVCIRCESSPQQRSKPLCMELCVSPTGALFITHKKDLYDGKLLNHFIVEVFRSPTAEPSGELSVLHWCYEFVLAKVLFIQKCPREPWRIHHMLTQGKDKYFHPNRSWKAESRQCLEKAPTRELGRAFTQLFRIELLQSLAQSERANIEYCPSLLTCEITASCVPYVSANAVP
eukprot:scaffold196738_cov18-Tisochrysis_lutea.AAC.2